MREIKDNELDNHHKDLDVYGYTVIKNVMPKNTIHGLIKKVNAEYTQINNLEDLGLPDRDAKDKLVYNLQNKDLEFINILTYQPVKSILIRKLNDQYYRFLDESKPNYILSYYNARSSGSHLPLHIDSYIPSPGAHTWVMQVVFL